MDLRQVRSFVHIAELHSFTRAAAFLHISQPALSRQMRLLEEELSLKLFHRHGHGVELTTHGVSFLERCRELLGDFEGLRQDFRDIGKGSAASGEVGIGLPVPATRFISAEFLDKLKVAHPTLSVRVVEGFSALLHEWLLSGSLDLAILFEPRASKILTHEPLLVEDLYAIRSAQGRGRRKHMEAMELADGPLILPQRPHVLRDLLDGLGLEHDTQVIEVSATSIMIDLARAGKGITILPQGSVDTAVRAGDVVALPIMNPALSWQVTVSYSSVRSLSPAARTILRVLRSEITEKVRSGEWTARLLGRHA